MPPIPIPQGWTTGDVALITASGVVLAAFIALLGAAFAATINAWSARRIARDTAKRNLIAKGFEPYIAKINQRLNTCHRAMRVGSQITAGVAQANAARKPGENLPENEKQRLLELAAELVKLADDMHEQHRAEYDPAMLAHGDQKLIDANALWVSSVSDFIKRAGEFNFMAVKDEQLAELQQLVWTATVNGGIVVAVMQEVTIGRTWWSRRWYATLRKLGWAKIRI